MTSTWILITYLVLLAVQVIVALALDVLNLSFVKKHALRVPPIFAGSVDHNTYTRSVSYTLDKAYLSIAGTIVSSIVLVLILFTRFFGVLDRALLQAHLQPYLHSVAFIFLAAIIISLTELPLRLYSIFVLEERYGFNKMTFVQWVLDSIKGFILSIVLFAPLLLGLFWFMDNAGPYWWVYGFALVSGFQIVVSFLYPIFIAPLFNKFTPLEEGNLKERIFETAKKVGFKSAGIFVMDGSKRSSHANAYFAGFGGSKRIVLFDTLVQLLTVDQAVAVLAHEMGHAKMHHVKRMLAVSLVISFIGFWILSLFFTYEPLFLAFGFNGTSYHGALTVLAFCSGPITFFIGPCLSNLSRTFEYQADAFAAKVVGETKSLGDALLALSKKSLSNLTPHPLYSFFHYSHPTLFERVQALNKLESSRSSRSN